MKKKKGGGEKAATEAGCFSKRIFSSVKNGHAKGGTEGTAVRNKKKRLTHHGQEKKGRGSTN